MCPILYKCSPTGTIKMSHTLSRFIFFRITTNDADSNSQLYHRENHTEVPPLMELHYNDLEVYMVSEQQPLSYSDLGESSIMWTPEPNEDSNDSTSTIPYGEEEEDHTDELSSQYWSDLE